MSGRLVSLGEYEVTHEIFLKTAEKSCVFIKFVEYTHGIPGEAKSNVVEGTKLISPKETNPKSLKRDQLVVEELGTELMIYDQKRNQAFCLNQKAAFVWQHCDGQTTVAAIAAKMEQSLGEPVDEKVVEFALQSLAQDGLLEPANSLFVATGMTRRDLIQKVGVRAAVALPLVTALLVATPKAHASGTSSGGGKPKKPRW
jgi:hypothetical protein